MDIYKSFIIVTEDSCMLCNQSIRFVLRRDRHKRFRFTFFKSQYAREHFATYIPDADSPTSLLVIDPKGKVLKNSDAVLKIFLLLGNGWKLVSILSIIPRFIRDSVYQFISKYRYRWFGYNEHCTLDYEFADRFYQ